MRIIVNISHPAHVHLFKHFIREMERRGHELLLVASDKEVILDLLDLHGFDYTFSCKRYSGISLAYELVKRDAQMFRLARSFKPDILMGVNDTIAAHVSRVTKARSIIFTDTEHAKLANMVTFPFADVICTPSSFMDDLGARHIRYEGYHELSYLHPTYFSPDRSVLERLGLDENDNLFLVRFAAFNANHDTKSQNFKKEYVKPLLEKLENEGRVLISSERKLGSELEKYRYSLSPENYHDVLYYSKMYIGESSTSAEEAAVLGTPSLNFERIMVRGKPHSFGDLCGILTEMEGKYGLVHCFHDENALLNKVDEFLAKGVENVKREWREKSRRLLEDKIDVTRFMVWFVENFPESFRVMKENAGVQEQFRQKKFEPVQAGDKWGVYDDSAWKT